MGILSREEKSENKLERLKHLVPLNALPQEALVELLRQCKFESLKKGDLLFQQGDTASSNVYLLTGEIELLADGKVVDTLAAESTNARYPIAHEFPRKLSARASKRKIDIVRVESKLLSKYMTKDDTKAYEVADTLDEGSDDWMSQLLSSPVFQRLPAASIQGVMMHMEEVAVEKGRKIILQGEEGDYFYFISRGQCVISTTDAGGKSIEEDRAGAGASFGEEALLTGDIRNATVTLLTDGVLMRLSKENFLRFVKEPLGDALTGEQASQRVAEGAVWLDVRTPEEFARGHLPGSVNLPVRKLRKDFGKLDADKVYVAYCDNGRRSTSAAYLLIERGLDAWFLKGGLEGAGGKFAEVLGLSGGQQAKSAPAAQSTAAETRPSLEEEVSREYQNRLSNAMDAIDKTRVVGGEGAESEHERKRMREALTQLKKALTAKNEELKQVKASANEAQEMRERLQQMEDLLRSEQAKANMTEKEKAAYTAKLQKNAEKYKEYIKRQESQQGKLQDELNKALMKMEQLEAEKAKVEELQKELEAAKSEREAVQRRIAELQKQREASQGAAQNAGEKIKGLEEQLRKRENEGEAVETLRKELERARQVQQEAQKKITDLQSRQDATRNELQSAGSKIQSLESELSEREGTESEQEEKYRAALGELEKQLDSARLAQQETSAHTKEVEEERKRLAGEVEVMRSQMEQVQKKADQDMERLKRQLLETQSKLKDKEGKGGNTAEQAALKQQLDGLQKALERSEQERQGLKDYLDNRADELHALKSRLTDAQVEAEEAAFRRQEAEAARKQVEEALYKLQEQVEKERAIEEARGGMVGEAEEAPPGGSMKAGIMGAVIGVAVVAGGAYFALFTDAGRNLLGLSHSSTVVVSTPAKPGPAEPAPGKETPPAETAPTEPPPAESKRPAVVDRSGEPADGTAIKDTLAGGGPAPELVYLRGVPFTMGDAHSILTSDERPAHEVILNSYAIGAYEVTFDQYDAFTKATNRKPVDDNGWGRGNLPVINVTWDDAVAYTKWLSQQSGKKYRLPSEAEWEYAAGGGSAEAYWWGKTPGMNKSNCFNCGSRFDGRIAPVGSFKANPYGLHDTAGNVMEWVEDCYHPSYDRAPEDGSAWVGGFCGERVLRGGAYNRPAESMRTTKRGSMEPKESLPMVGFRVARDIGE